MWLVRRLYGDSAVTKGGNEYAVLVIILYTSQFVFQYVISIIKLPKPVTNDAGSCQGVGGRLVGGRGDTEGGRSGGGGSSLQRWKLRGIRAKNNAVG